MRNPLKLMPLGAWLGLVIVGLGAWARDIFGVVLGGILAVATLVMTDRQQAAQDAKEEAAAEDITTDERFKDM
ncbi:MAG: hypothetical protein ACJ72O_01415 [Marmoricola sp.]